jgi:large subunit ribosomal protein L28
MVVRLTKQGLSMPRVCYFTGKKSASGWKKAEKGGIRTGTVGNKIMSRTKRMIKPNLKKLRIVINGKVQSVYVSTRALKKGLVIKPLRVKKPAAASA